MIRFLNFLFLFSFPIVIGALFIALFKATGDADREMEKWEDEKK